MNKPEDIDKVLEEAIVTVFPEATSALLAPIASSPSVTVKSPLISNSLNADFVPELLITKLKKLLLEPVVMLLPAPLKVTVPAEGVNPPLFPLSSQLPATSKLVLTKSKVPAVKVKSPKRFTSVWWITVWPSKLIVKSPIVLPLKSRYISSSFEEELLLWTKITWFALAFTVTPPAISIAG